MNKKLSKMKEAAEGILYGDKRIHAGIERVVKVKEQNNKAYIKIQCFSLNGKFKGSYDLGYVDTVSNEYVAGKDIDLNNL